MVVTIALIVVFMSVLTIALISAGHVTVTYKPTTSKLVQFKIDNEDVTLETHPDLYPPIVKVPVAYETEETMVEVCMN